VTDTVHAVDRWNGSQYNKGQFEGEIMTSLLECFTKHITNNCDEEEATEIAAAVLESFDCLQDVDASNSLSSRIKKYDDLNESHRNDLEGLLCDYIPEIEPETSHQIVHNAIRDYLCKDSDSIEDSDDEEFSVHSKTIQHDSDVSIESDGAYLEDGSCELCERELKLSKHHMIPKSTWPRIKPRFLAAAPYLSNGDIASAEEKLKIGPIPSIILNSHVDFSVGSHVKLFLGHYTCSICSSCHSTVHGMFDNMELAEERNSVEKLLEDEQLVKFCKWANKQKAGKKSRRRDFR
jgi:hypothetical protein